MSKPYDRGAEDLGNIVALEHVNLQIEDQAMATLFYIVGLGLTRDPYMMVGLDNMWVNIGEQQFHLPTRKPQRCAATSASSCRPRRAAARGWKACEAARGHAVRLHGA